MPLTPLASGWVRHAFRLSSLTPTPRKGSWRRSAVSRSIWRWPSRTHSIMEYRNVGRSGLQVSVAGLGCNNFGMRIDKDQTAVVVHRALDLGVTLFDTADIYGGTR